jgi:hypothetical protein
MKLPHFFTNIEEHWFYSRFIAAIVLSALIIYFLSQHPQSQQSRTQVMLATLGCVLWLMILPDQANSDTLFLSLAHMPFILWSLMGLAFSGQYWTRPNDRLTFIRFNGELWIYNTIILLGGITLTALTFALFEALDAQNDIEDWYMKNVVIWGCVSSPLLATFLIDKMPIGSRRIAPLLAKIFSPLFLITVFIYLFAMLAKSRSLYLDRDFLLTFNCLLLLVLAIAVFSITENPYSQESTFFNIVNSALIIMTLIIDLIALTAIIYRLFHYGITPNKLVVLIANLLIFIHLIGILKAYVDLLRGLGNYAAIEKWIVNYLPIYTLWSAIVVFILPLIFAFR